MSTFAEYLKEQAPRIRSQADAKEQRRKEWMTAVVRLFDRMKIWLLEIDEDQVLKLEMSEVELSEEAIGRYKIPTLTIWLDGRFVRVEPVAFDVMGPAMGGPGLMDKVVRRPRGRVDIVGSSHTYNLYRIADERGQDDWYFLDDRTYLGGMFTREAFDAALMSLFQ